MEDRQDVLFLAKLQERNVLSDDDVAEINAEKNYLKQSKLFYGIIVTKANSYDTLVKALTDTQQSGATKYLFHPSEKIGNLKVHFQGKTQQLGNLLSNTQINDIYAWQQKSKFSETEREEIAQILSEQKELELFRDPIPKRDDLYIDRFVSVPQIVDPSLFKKSCPDIFVFLNKDLSYLSDYVDTTKIESSTKLLLPKTFGKVKQIYKKERNEKDSPRFILVGSKNDWEYICAEIPETPVHLLEYELKHNAFVVKATFGGSQILWEHLNYKQANANPEYISEEVFVEQILTENVKGVCICDLPGMGKSDLLANIARRMEVKCPESITCFIQLRDFVPPINPDLHKKNILDHVCTSKLASEFLYELTKDGSIQFNIFFDGLDEVHRTDLQSVTEFLRKVRESMPDARLFLTSRPVVRTELERSVRFIAYDILPFTEENQRNYLAAYWIHKHPNSDEAKLNEFAEILVQSFRKALKKNIKTVSGVPLQCQLIAEVYSDEAAVFADKDRKDPISLPENVVISLSEIYSKFMLRLLGPSKCRFACMHKLASSDEPECDVICKVKSFHIWQALKLIDKNFTEKLKLKGYITAFDLKPNQFKSPGILKHRKKDEPYEFLHRTFAEFLVAEYCANVLFSKPSHLKRNKIYDKIAEEFLFGRLLLNNSDFILLDLKIDYHVGFYSIKEALLPYFLNDSLTDCFCAGDELCVGAFLSGFEGYLAILKSCLHPDYQSFLKVLLQGIQKFEQQTQSRLGKVVDRMRFAVLQDNEQKQKINAVLGVLQVAAVCSDVATINQLFQFFQNGLNFVVVAKLTKLKMKESPMQMAVKRGDFHVVKCLANKFNLKNLGLLYWCFKDTYYENEESVEIKLNIAQLLISKEADLLTETFIKPANGYFDDNYIGKEAIPVIFVPHIHFKAIEFLVNAGVNVKTVDTLHGNVYIHALGYMSDEDFETLRKFLFVQCNAQDWFLDLENCKKYFCPSGYYQIKVHNVKTVLRVLDKLLKETVIMHENQNAEGTLLQSKFCRGLFVHAVATGNVEIVDFFLEQDPTFLEQRHSEKLPNALVRLSNFRQLDYRENITYEMLDIQLKQMRLSENVTPILLAAKFGQAEMVNFLVNQGANIFAVDGKSRTILHLAPLSSNSQAFEQIVCIVSEKRDTSLQEYQIDLNSQTEPKNLLQLFNWHDNEELNRPLHEAAKYIDLSSERFSLFLSYGQGPQPFTMPILQPFQLSIPDIQTTELANKLSSIDFDDHTKKLGESQEQMEMSLQTSVSKFLSCERNDKTVSVNINAVNKYGHSALHYAILYRRELELVQRFVSMGADWTMKDNQGCNVAHICAQMMLPDHLKYFLGLGGADFANQLDHLGNNALQCAIANWKMSRTPAGYYYLPGGSEKDKDEIMCAFKEGGIKVDNEYQ